MRGLDKYASIFISAASLFCCAPNVEQSSTSSLENVANRVAAIIKSGDLELLYPILETSDITFDDAGRIDEGIRCFLNWETRCKSGTRAIRDILARETFMYYYHLDDDNIIVSYIDERSRDDFDRNILSFLEHEYLNRYFSCQFVRVDGEWFLKESVCFSETDGPFDLGPEI